MPYNNNNCDCRMDDIEYTIVLNEQGPQGRQGRQGEDGFSPSITVSVDTPSVYQLTITTKDQVINTPNLKANIPDPTFDGAVLTVNEDAALGYAWQELPWARTDQRGTVQLATDSDLTPDPELGYNDVVPTIEQLADEITNRTTADTTLQANITAEQTTREAADTTLQTNIDNEASARQSADTTLQNNINTLEQSLDNGLATKQDTLTAGTNIEITSENVINNTYSYTLPQATAEALGGIKASARTEDDTQEVKIDTTTGILYTSPTGDTGGTNDYTELENKPSINNVILQGNITLDQLGIQAAGDYVTTNTEQTISEKKTFTNGLDVGLIGVTATEGDTVYNIISSPTTMPTFGNTETTPKIDSNGQVYINRVVDNTPELYVNIDNGNLSEYAQPLLTNLATKDELDSYLTKTDAADTYATASEVDTLTSTVTGLETSKQDVLTAGDGITIEGNVISATGGGSGELELEAQLPLEIITGDPNGSVTISGSNFSRNLVAPATGNLLTPSINKGGFGSTGRVSIPASIQDNKLYLDRKQTISAKLVLDQDKRIYRGPYNADSSKNLLVFGKITDDGEVTHIGWCCYGGNYSGNPSFEGGYYEVSQYINEFDINILSGVNTVRLSTATRQTFEYGGPTFPSGNGTLEYQLYTTGSGTLGCRMRFRDAVSSESIKSQTWTFNGYPYEENIPNFVILPTETETLYPLSDYRINDNEGNLVWDPTFFAIGQSIKLNYDNTLTLNDNQLSVNSGGLNIPTSTSQLTNDSGFITKDVDDLANYTPTSGLATVATTGSYNDLQDKPTIPSEYVLPTATTTTLGGVKPDGSTITITADGTISAVGGGGGSGDNYVTTDTVQNVGSYKTFTNGVYGIEAAVTASSWEISGGCLLGEHNTDTDNYIPYILKANPSLGGNLPLGLYIGNPTEGIPPNLVAYEEGGQGNYSYPQTFYHSTTGDNQSFPLLDTKNFEAFVSAGDGITITNNGGSYTISGSGAAADAATLSGNNTFTGDNTFTGSVTVGGGAVVTANNVGTYAATTTQGTNADTAIANLNGFKFWSGTQSEYDGLAAKDNTTLYIITGD